MKDNNYNALIWPNRIKYDIICPFWPNELNVNIHVMALLAQK